MPPMIETIPGLQFLPDIPTYYAQSRGFSFILDLLILCAAFAELLKFAGEKAKIPTRLSTILGLILGAALTFAIHGAGFSLLTHWFTILLIALVVSTATYNYAHPHWGKWRALGLALGTGFVIMGIGGKAMFGDAFSGWLALIWIIFFMSVIFALISGALSAARQAAGGGSTGGGGGGGGRTGGPDLSPIVKAITDLQKQLGDKLDAQGSTLTKLEQLVAKIEGSLTNILQRLDKLEEFFNKWKDWFDKVNDGFDAIKQGIIRAGKMAEQYFESMMQWKQQWEQFRDGTNAALDAVKKQLADIGKHLTDIISQVSGITAAQAEIRKTVEKHDGVLASLSTRIEQLPEAVKAGLRYEFKGVTDELEIIKSKLRSQTEIKDSVDRILEFIQKLELPETREIINRVEAGRESIRRKIGDLSDQITDLAKQSPKLPPDQATVRISAMQNLCRDLQASIGEANITMEKIRDLGPRMSELLQGASTLKQSHQTLSALLNDFESKFNSLAAKASAAMQEQSRKDTEEQARAGAEAAKAAAPAEQQIADLDAIEQSLNAQAGVLNSILPKIKKLIGELSFAQFEAKADEATWKAIAQQAIEDAKKTAGEINLETQQITALEQAITKARQDLDTYLAMGLGEAGLTKVAGRLRLFETQLLGFFSNIEQSLVQQVVAAIDARIQERRQAGAKAKEIKSVSGATIIEALNKYVKKIEEAVAFTSVLGEEVRTAKKQVRKAAEEAVKRAKSKPRKPAGAKRPLGPGRVYEEEPGRL